MATLSVESFHDEGPCEDCGQPFTQDSYNDTVSCWCFEDNEDDY